jgi:Domain of Unknown Function (DUF1206)
MIEALARIGFMSRALVYFATGFLALISVLGYSKKKETDLHYSLQVLASIPFGKVLIVLIGLGLLAYALWKFFQAFLDADHLGKKLSSLFLRFTYFINGLIHVSLAYFCYRTFLHLRVQDQDDRARAWIEWLMEMPWGKYLVGIVGLSFIGFALTEIIRAILKKYEHGFELNSSHFMIHFIARFGIISRAIIFLILGFLILKSAWHFKAAYAGGFGHSWYYLLSQDSGISLSFVIAFGLMAYGIYTALLATLRKI